MYTYSSQNGQQFAEVSLSRQLQWNLLQRSKLNKCRTQCKPYARHSTCVMHLKYTNMNIQLKDIAKLFHSGSPQQAAVALDHNLDKWAGKEIHDEMSESVSV